MELSGRMNEYEWVEASRRVSEEDIIQRRVEEMEDVMALYIAL